jgi:hypothetical protein
MGGWSFLRQHHRLLAQLGLGVFSLVLIVGPFSGLSNLLYQRTLAERAVHNLDEALEKNLIVFATLSVIKGSVALVEGSSVGMGFAVEVGDLVQPAYDYIDFVWRLFLYSILILTFYKQLLDSGILGLGLPIFGLGMGLLVLAPLFKKKNRALQPAGRWLARFGLLIAYGIPIVLILSDTLSRTYTDPLKEKSTLRIEQISNDFLQSKNEFIFLKDKFNLSRPTESIEDIRLSLLRIVRKVSSTAWESVGVLLYYVSILIFDLLFLPVIMGLLLYFTFHIGLGRLQFRPQNVKGDKT